MGAPAGDLHIITNVGSAQILHAQGRQHLCDRADHGSGSGAGRKDRSADGGWQDAVANSAGNAVRSEVSFASSAARHRLRNPGAKGDQFVEVQVTLPKVISEETKELVAGVFEDELGESEGGDGT